LNTIHFIINPNSGKKKGKQFHDYLTSLQNEKFVIKLSSFIGETVELAKKSVEEKASIIVSCGGDGTLREVASALVNTDIPLGIIPIGSGNGVARALKIPLKPELALRQLLHGKIATIDVGKVNENYFFSNFGIGIDSEIINTFSSQTTRGLIGYVKSSVLTIFKFKPIKLKITLENKSIENTYFLCNVANANQIGYDFTFSPEAQLNDGLLNVLMVEKFNFFGWLAYGYYFMQKRIKNFSKATNINTKFIEIEVISDVKCYQLDGDKIALNNKKFSISIIENGLKVIC